YGVLQLGAIFVPMNTRLEAEEYEYILNHSGSTVLYMDGDFQEIILPVRDKLKTVKTIICNQPLQEDNTVVYEDMLANQSTEQIENEQIEETCMRTLLYTCGTIGELKVVMLTHRNNYLHAISSMHHLQVTVRDVLLHVLPMFHVNGWGSPFYYTANGATHVC